MSAKLVWASRDGDGDGEIFQEIESQTDRGVALIVGAYVEDRLVSAIQARTNRHKKIEDNLFKGAGPLASFSAKIDLGLLLGIYEIQYHKMLHCIRKVRNEFAHVPEPTDFNSQRIFDLCKSINFHLEMELERQEDGLRFEFDFVPDGTARTAFVNSARYLIVILDMEIKQMPPRSPAPPVMPSLPKSSKPLPLQRHKKKRSK